MKSWLYAGFTQLMPRNVNIIILGQENLYLSLKILNKDRCTTKKENFLSRIKIEYWMSSTYVTFFNCSIINMKYLWTFMRFRKILRQR